MTNLYTPNRRFLFGVFISYLSQMPYYRITVTEKTGRVRTGIKNTPISDIDVYFMKMRQKAIVALKDNFQNIDVVMLSRYSKEVADHIAAYRKIKSVVYDPKEQKQ